MKQVMTAAACSMLASCSAFEAKNPLEEARNLSALSDKCLLDVRDNALKYETSTNCQSLREVARIYINAGGQRTDEPLESKLVDEQALRTAWHARAVSASENPGISLW